MAVQSVQRAIDILREVAFEPDGLGVRELAARLDLRPSTAQNIINTLSDNGLLSNNDEDRRYRLSTGAWVLAQGLNTAESIRMAVDDYMKSLTRNNGANSEIVCWSKGRYCRIGLWQSSGGFRQLPSGPEERRRIHHSAVGQALLAWSDEEWVAEYLEQAEYEVSGNIPSNPSELRACLEQIHMRGYASTETTASAKYLTGLAMPILAPNGRLLAALNFHKGISQKSESFSSMQKVLKESVIDLSKIITGINTNKK